MSDFEVWQDLAFVDELEVGDVTPVRHDGREFAIFDGKAGISVTAGRCTHGAALLADGYFDGCRIECPLHQGLFDCVTGRALAAPATRNLTVFACRVRDGKVQIRLVNATEKR